MGQLGLVMVIMRMVWRALGHLILALWIPDLLVDVKEALRARCMWRLGHDGRPCGALMKRILHHQ